jgi:pilus assembly protein CpaD
MTASSKSLAALLAFGVLAAAAPASAQGVNKSLYSQNQPIVQRSDYVLDLAAPNGVSPAERARLRAWFASLDLGYGDKVAVDEAYPTAARADIARIAAEYGLLLSDGAPVTTGRVEPGSARVIVSRSFASVPGCPRWSGSEKNNATSPGYGCATNSNLAAMIADPSDLVLGQAGSGASDGTVGAKAIKVYRETPPSGSKGLSGTSTAGGGK